MTTLSHRIPRVQPAPRRDLSWVTLALPAPILPFAVGIARPESPGRPRAPKGGLVVAGRFYKGGQLLPATSPVANPRDLWPAWTDEDRWTIAGPAASEIDLTAFATRADSPAPPAAVATEFAIHGFRYAAREIPAGECGSVAFELHRPDTNHTYHVVRDGYGEVTCSCPDFELRRAGSGQPCKHGRKLIELGLVAAPTPHTAATVPAPRPRRFERRRRRWSRRRNCSPTRRGTPTPAN